MTAVKCCGILFVNKSTLTKWEQGKHKPSRANREQIVIFLGFKHKPNREHLARIRRFLNTFPQGLGVDEFIDYTNHDFATVAKNLDVGF